MLNVQFLEYELCIDHPFDKIRTLIINLDLFLVALSCHHSYAVMKRGEGAVISVYVKHLCIGSYLNTVLA
jgi:hypothetical protein